MGFILGAIMLVVAMLVLASAYGLEAVVTRPRPAAGLDTTAAPLARTLVGKQLSIPASWFRSPVQKQDGFASQIELEVSLPLGRNGTTLPIDVTLLPLSQVRPSASLLDGVYLHQFMPNELAGPPGLVGKPLYGTEGFENETVWYDALSQDPFVAKCIAPPEPQGATRCLRTVALADGIAAVYGFDMEALYDWRDFDPQMHTWLARIGAQ
jgi:hypothetical protein